MVAKRPRIVIIGAGMAGLTAAHRLCSITGDLINLFLLEASDRLGGCVISAEFAGGRVEMGAIGIVGSPIHAIDVDIGALSDSVPYECMDGIPGDLVTVAEGDGILIASIVDLALRDGVPVVRRFIGGRTVIVDDGTIFVTIICDKSAVSGLQPYPRPIISWTGDLYASAFCGFNDFRPRKNDYGAKDPYPVS